MLSQTAIDLETANNIDLTFRKTQGDVGFVFNAFYNQVDNYYFQEETGLFAESGHDHDHGEEGHGEEGHDEHSDELPVYLFTCLIQLTPFFMVLSYKLPGKPLTT